MAILHLMVGLPCSGKTTLARALEAQFGALRLTPDDWQRELFGQDATEPAHDERHDRIEALLWGVAARALALGVDVVLDFGLWSRAEREAFRRRATALGARTEIHFLDVPEAELFVRLERRNQEPSEVATHISPDALRGYLAQFEPLEAEELGPVDGPFYHGTRADLAVGDLLVAGRPSNFRPEVVMNHVYFTTLPNGAGLAAALAPGEAAQRVYLVEPTGAWENDPNLTDKRFPGNPTRSFRTAHPLRIVGEIEHWVRKTPEEIQAWRERLARNTGEIVN